MIVGSGLEVPADLFLRDPAAPPRLQARRQAPGEQIHERVESTYVTPLMLEHDGLLRRGQCGETVSVDHNGRPDQAHSDRDRA